MTLIKEIEKTSYTVGVSARIPIEVLSKFKTRNKTKFNQNTLEMFIEQDFSHDELEEYIEENTIEPTSSKTKIISFLCPEALRNESRIKAERYNVDITTILMCAMIENYKIESEVD